jgi:hypothetical protein
MSEFEQVKNSVIFRENIAGLDDTVVELLFENFAQRGQISNIEYMIECGYKPHSSNAFYFAAESGYLSLVQLLADEGAYRHMDDAIFAASENGFTDVVEFLNSL